MLVIFGGTPPLSRISQYRGSTAHEGPASAQTGVVYIRNERLVYYVWLCQLECADLN
jgi:hypothetical protein